MANKVQAEARLRDLAMDVLAVEGLPTSTSDIELLQAFCSFGLSEPKKREISFTDIFAKYGVLGWFLSKVFAKRFVRIVQELEGRERFYRDDHREEMCGFRDELRLRKRLLDTVVHAEAVSKANARDEARSIRSKASRAASKTREGCVTQLQELLKFAKIRVLQKQLEFAKESELHDEILRLEGLITEEYRKIYENLGSIAKAVASEEKFNELIIEAKPKTGNQSK